MRRKFVTLSSLAFTVTLIGCHSGGTNIPVSRDSETGQAIASMDAAKRQYQKNVALYEHAMTEYEKAHGDRCGRIMFSSIVGPKETPESRVRVNKLQGSSRQCGYQDYRARITYADDACHVAQTVEIVERMAQ